MQEQAEQQRRRVQVHPGARRYFIRWADTNTLAREEYTLDGVNRWVRDHGGELTGRFKHPTTQATVLTGYVLVA